MVEVEEQTDLREITSNDPIPYNKVLITTESQFGN